MSPAAGHRSHPGPRAPPRPAIKSTLSWLQSAAEPEQRPVPRGGQVDGRRAARSAVHHPASSHLFTLQMAADVLRRSHILLRGEPLPLHAAPVIAFQYRGAGDKLLNIPPVTSLVHDKLRRSPPRPHVCWQLRYPPPKERRVEGIL